MKTEKELQKFSVFLCGVLRHDPKKVSIQLDTQGYVDITVLLEKLSEHNKPITRDELLIIVAQDQKSRYRVTDNMIRCNQGHSTSQVKIDYLEVIPPDFLFHGTSLDSVKAIDREGLISGKRHHVHLSDNQATATQVGGRHGEPFTYIVQARRMRAEGYKFYLSDNGVWLTDCVPAKYLIK